MLMKKAERRKAKRKQKKKLNYHNEEDKVTDESKLVDILSFLTQGKEIQEMSTNNSESDDNDEFCEVREAPKQSTLDQNLHKMTYEEIKREVLDIIKHLPLLDRQCKDCNNEISKLNKVENHLRKYRSYLAGIFFEFLHKYEKCDYTLLSIYFKFLDRNRGELFAMCFLNK